MTKSTSFERVPLEFTWAETRKRPRYCAIRIFYVLLTVHLGTILVNNQLDAQFFFLYVYFSSVRASRSHVLIIRRVNCINTTSGMCHFLQVSVWYAGLDGSLHTRRSRVQGDIYQMSYLYNWLSWWWANGCSKTVENWNKHIEKKKNCASSWLFTRIVLFDYSPPINLINNM